MDFAQKVLEKYGWKEGDGLGKNNDGIKEAIKPKLKANNLGLGYKLGSEFQDKWWENAYNAAASNINVKNDKEGVCSVSAASENSEYLPHKRKKKKKLLKDDYSLFHKGNEQTSSEEKSEEPLLIDSDDRIFKECGGRTAHKGARHGLSLSGKLRRLEKQEKELMLKMKENSLKKKHKKLVSSCTR